MNKKFLEEAARFEAYLMEDPETWEDWKKIARSVRSGVLLESSPLTREIREFEESKDLIKEVEVDWCENGF